MKQSDVLLTTIESVPYRDPVTRRYNRIVSWNGIPHAVIVEDYKYCYYSLQTGLLDAQIEMENSYSGNSNIQGSYLNGKLSLYPQQFMGAHRLGSFFITNWDRNRTYNMYLGQVPRYPNESLFLDLLSVRIFSRPFDTDGGWYPFVTGRDIPKQATIEADIVAWLQFNIEWKDELWI